MEPVSRNKILTNMISSYNTNKKPYLVKSIQNRFNQMNSTMNSKMNSKLNNKLHTIGKNKNKKKYNKRNSTGNRLLRQMIEMENLQKNHNIVKKIETEKKVIKLENLLSCFKI